LNKFSAISTSAMLSFANRDILPLFSWPRLIREPTLQYIKYD